MRRLYITVNAAAELFGVEVREFRERLWKLHEKHGGVIFRYSTAPNAKLWTSKEALRKHFPDAFGEITQLDILEVLEQLQETRARLAKVEKKVSAK